MATTPFLKCVAIVAGLTTPAVPADAPVRDASPPTLVRQINEALAAFDRGSALLTSAPDEAMSAFREARDKFQAVVDAGVQNGRLYYNLGNTHLRLDEVGRAIADYRRAERLIPGNRRLKANLRFARSLRRDHITVAGEHALLRTVFFWHYSAPLRTRATAAMVGYGLFWLLLIVHQLWPRVRVRYGAFACLALWVILLGSIAIDFPSHGTPTAGVLVTDDVIVRKGNAVGYAPQFEQPLHDGVEFKVAGMRGGWVYIELANGSRGWVREQEVELF
jgi:hypothetical protein